MFLDYLYRRGGVIVEWWSKKKECVFVFDFCLQSSVENDEEDTLVVTGRSTPSVFDFHKKWQTGSSRVLSVVADIINKMKERTKTFFRRYNLVSILKNRKTAVLLGRSPSVCSSNRSFRSGWCWRVSWIFVRSELNRSFREFATHVRVWTII